MFLKFRPIVFPIVLLFKVITTRREEKFHIKSSKKIKKKKKEKEGKPSINGVSRKLERVLLFEKGKGRKRRGTTMRAGEGPDVRKRVLRIPR